MVKSLGIKLILLLAAALLVVSSGARALASEMFAGTTNGVLYSVNPMTAASTLVGPFIRSI